MSYPTLRKAWLTLLTCVMGVTMAGVAHAQYLDHDDDDGGYLDDNEAVPTQHPMHPGPPEPFVTFGLNLGVGGAHTSYNELDDSFFVPNQGASLGDVVSFHLQGAGFLEFGHVGRVGLALGGNLGGDGRTFASLGDFGILGAGGFGLSPTWSLWLGGIVGFENLFARSADATSRDLEYDAQALFLRPQISLEGDLSPSVALTFEAFASFSSVIDEEFSAESAGAVAPVESDFDPLLIGLVVGVNFSL